MANKSLRCIRSNSLLGMSNRETTADVLEVMKRYELIDLLRAKRGGNLKQVINKLGPHQANIEILVELDSSADEGKSPSIMSSIEDREDLDFHEDDMFLRRTSEGSTSTTTSSSYKINLPPSNDSYDALNDFELNAASLVTKDSDNENDISELPSTTLRGAESSSSSSSSSSNSIGSSVQKRTGANSSSSSSSSRSQSLSKGVIVSGDKSKISITNNSVQGTSTTTTSSSNNSKSVDPSSRTSSTSSATTTDAQSFFARAITGIRSGSQNNMSSSGAINSSSNSISFSGSKTNVINEQETEEKQDFFSRAFTGIRNVPRQSGDVEDMKARRLDSKLKLLDTKSKSQRFDSKLKDLENQKLKTSTGVVENNDSKQQNMKSISPSNLEEENSNSSTLPPPSSSSSSVKVFTPPPPPSPPPAHLSSTSLPTTVSSVQKTLNDLKIEENKNDVSLTSGGITKQEEARRRGSAIMLASEALAKVAFLRQVEKENNQDDADYEVDKGNGNDDNDSYGDYDSYDDYDDYEKEGEGEGVYLDKRDDDDHDSFETAAQDETIVKKTGNELTQELQSGDDSFLRRRSDRASRTSLRESKTTQQLDEELLSGELSMRPLSSNHEEVVSDSESAMQRRSSKRSSKKKSKKYTYEELKRLSMRKEISQRLSLRDAFNPEVLQQFSEREKLLTDEEFEIVFGISKVHFHELPKWRQQELKKRHKLF